jgi:hypothetical protein
MIEWRWIGRRTTGEHFNQQGVTVLAVQEDQIAWSRLYMSEVSEGET